VVHGRGEGSLPPPGHWNSRGVGGLVVLCFCIGVSPKCVVVLVSSWGSCSPFSSS
jgi:hypothetical protein